jgi:arylsulfatase
VDVEEKASGVLYAVGGSGGGLSCYLDDGYLCFEYNLMIIYRSLARSKERLSPGKHTILVETLLATEKPGSAADIVLSVDGTEVARTDTKMTVPGLFNASESFDVGIDLGSPVARDYFERAPFPFSGEIKVLTVSLTRSPQ